MTQSNTDTLEFAINVAREAGAIILRYFDVQDKQVELKPNDTPVTAADNLINQLVIDRVTATFPEHGVLGEEGSNHAERKELWVCDPLDGTKSFIQRVPTAMFSLAFVVDGRPEVAVLFDPFQNKLFSAIRGEGAKANGVPIHVSTLSDMKGATVSVSTGYAGLKQRQALFDRLLEQGAEQLFVPGGVFKSSIVATGNIDGYYFPGKGAHDIAAAKLIVEEAGGKVTDLYGNEQRYDGPIYGAIVSNGALHDQMVALMANFGPENFIGY